MPILRNPETAREKGGFDAYNESTFGSPSSSEAGCSIGGVKELQIFPMMAVDTATKPSASRHEEGGSAKSLTFRNTSSDEEDEESSHAPPIEAPGWTTPGSGSAKHSNRRTNESVAATNNDTNNDISNGDNNDDNIIINSVNLGIPSPAPPSHTSNTNSNNRNNSNISNSNGRSSRSSSSNNYTPASESPSSRRRRFPREAFPLTDAVQEPPPV